MFQTRFVEKIKTHILLVK